MSRVTRAGAINIVSAVGSAEYAHARLRARLGARPDEGVWRRLEVTRDLAPVLEQAHGGSLARWVQGLQASAGPHEIEQALRRRWRERVEELAGWVDQPWQDGVRWCARLVDLPVLAHAARGESLPAWVAADESVAQWLESPPADELVTAERIATDGALDAWLRAWRRRLPAGRARVTIEHRLVPLLRAHVRRFAAPAPQDGWARRRELGAQLMALLRRHPAQPIEVFCFLALQALELERLRAELCGRAAFPKRTLHA